MYALLGHTIMHCCNLRVGCQPPRPSEVVRNLGSNTDSVVEVQYESSIEASFFLVVRDDSCGAITRVHRFLAQRREVEIHLARFTVVSVSIKPSSPSVRVWVDATDVWKWLKVFMRLGFVSWAGVCFYFVCT